jgi:hypothetical protein
LSWLWSNLYGMLFSAHTILVGFGTSGVKLLGSTIIDLFSSYLDFGCCCQLFLWWFRVSFTYQGFKNQNIRWSGAWKFPIAFCHNTETAKQWCHNQITSKRLWKGRKNRSYCFSRLSYTVWLTAVRFATCAGIGHLHAMLVHTPAHSHWGVTLCWTVVSLIITIRNVHT